MKWFTFLKYLFVISGIILTCATAIHLLYEGADVLWIYSISVGTFFFFNLLIFLYAYNTSKSDQLFSFNNVVSGSFLLKLILSVSLLLIYERIFTPENDNHVLHFIFVYMIFMVYEVYYLTKLARSSD